jgi:hypothetical protein
MGGRAPSNSALETKTVRGKRAQSWQPEAGEGSSHCSTPSWMRPSPQKAVWQEEVQRASSALFWPSSHSSPGSWVPSPQVGGGVVSEDVVVVSVVAVVTSRVVLEDVEEEAVVVSVVSVVSVVLEDVEEEAVVVSVVSVEVSSL